MELKKNLYWCGALDPELRVFDIIMHTEFGTTYNAYLLKGSEKTALFETAKFKFFDSFIKNVQEITDVKKIDYLIMDHTEPDHAGSVEKLLEMNPSLTIVGTATAINFLKKIVNGDFYSLAVADDETLSLGDKTLQFMILPNLHWPDTMYTYCKEDRTLFTCDSFGSHYSFEEILRSKVTDEEGYKRATKYYFDNIIGPFKDPYMTDALERTSQIPIDMICPGHGPVLDSHLQEIRGWYEDWCKTENPNTKKTVVIPYVSAYGYTGLLAEKIAAGIKDAGDIEIKIYNMTDADQGEVMAQIGYADGFLLGTPTILGEALKPIWDITTSLFRVTCQGKLAGAFGSYGWSGEGVPNITDRLKQLKLRVVDGLQVRFKPGDADLIDAYDFGYNFGCTILGKENKRKKSGEKKYVKCLICGAIFDADLQVCPVCGVGPENFVPADSAEISLENNTQNKYVVLGGGIAAVAAARSIRERDKTGSIVLISNEKYLPYNRPMLTKTMMSGLTDDQIAIYPKQWYEDNKIKLRIGETVTGIDTGRRQILLGGETLDYDKCIYALGSRCFIPPIPGSEKNPKVIAIRCIEDVMKIRAMLPAVNNVVVIGGGVLGLEAAWEVKKAGKEVTVLEAAPQIMGRQIDQNAADVLCAIAKNRGIEIRSGVKISEISSYDEGLDVVTDQGMHPTQLVLVSAGVRANVEIAAMNGFTVDRAVIVNEKMETNFPDVYACGDCAQYNGVNFALWSEAEAQGNAAGANAAGDDVHYEQVDGALSFFGFGTRLYAIGDNGKKQDLHYRTAEIMDRQKETYVKCYFVSGRLSGVILIGDLSKMKDLTQAVTDHLSFEETMKLL